MHYPCELIRDLLPLYRDGVCSQATAAAVEEHLATCESCAAIHQKLIESDSVEPVSPDKPLSKSMAKLKTTFRRKILLRAGAAFLLAVILAFGIGMWLNTATITVPDDTITASEEKRSDGSQSLRVVLKKDYAYTGLGRTFAPSFESDGEVYAFYHTRITVWASLAHRLNISPTQNLYFDFDLPEIVELGEDLYDEKGNAGSQPRQWETTRAYFVPDYDALRSLGVLMHADRETLEKFIEEHAILLWEKAD